MDVLMLCSYAATRLRHACHMVVMGQDGRFMQMGFRMVIFKASEGRPAAGGRWRARVVPRAFHSPSGGASCLGGIRAVKMWVPQVEA